LPVSAAGIFASNLNQYGTMRTATKQPKYCQEQLEEIDVDVKEIEDKISKASKVSMKCLDPTIYDFDFVPMGKSTIRKDKSVGFSVGAK
jgi:uncharacterized glyoxalase superfamily metalloenzyme YdcJ